MKNCFIV